MGEKSSLGSWDPEILGGDRILLVIMIMILLSIIVVSLSILSPVSFHLIFPTVL